MARARRAGALPLTRHMKRQDVRSPQNLASSAEPAGEVNSSSVAVEGVAVRYGDVHAIRDVDLRIEPGEFVSLLGPSGSGKTTLLRTVAGFVTPDAGRILVGHDDVTRLAPRYRNFGMVFQRYALFPHMRVADNVAFGLKTRRVPRTQLKNLVDEALALVDLTAEAQRYPEQLSGGQQQRVALARAVVMRPSLLLMDEPLGALDLRLRQQLQADIRALQQRLAITTIYVTHDQEEAFSMSDRVVVMNAGRISCQGTPEELYSSPGSSFAATFVGHNTVFSLKRQDIPANGVVTGLPGQERPFRLSEPLAADTSQVFFVLGVGRIRCYDHPAPHTETATVLGRRFTGLNELITVQAGDTIMTLLAPTARREAGEQVHISWDPGDAHVIEESATGAVVRTGQVGDVRVPSPSGPTGPAVVGR